MAADLILPLAASGAVFAAYVGRRAARNEARAEAEHPPEGTFVEVDGVHLHAVIMGAGPDVVLIHGASGNMRDMTFALAPALAKRYRVLIFDRPGLGYTAYPAAETPSIARQADLISRAAAKLGASRPIVMGQSYGGAVALAWAIRHPDALAALVPLAAASNPWDTPLDTFYRITSSRLGGALLVPMMTAFTSDRKIETTLEAIFAPQPVPEGYAGHVGTGLTLRRRSLRANGAQRATILDEIIAQQSHYSAITVPTEIVHGTADPIVPDHVHSLPLAGQIPGATLTRLDGVGHMPHQVATDQVVAAIDRAAARAGLR